MKAYHKEFNIEKMAKVLGVSRCGYYEYLNKVPSRRTLENQMLIEEIKKIHKNSRRIYGSPRVHAELKKQGKFFSRKRIAKLMMQEKIQAKMRKKWKKTTQPSKKVVKIAPNHLEQNFTVEAPDKVWISDITYVATQEGWLYVAVVMDLFSRKVIGLGMGDRLETDLIMKALKQALYNRNIGQNLIHHSDRGCQYTSKEFQELAHRHGIKLSMSAKGRCYDNAVAESFFHTLKTEETHLCNYRIREEAKNSIFEYIEVFYNRKRLHSALGYTTPIDFEKAWKDRRALNVM
jgi:putative transposase